MSARKFAIALGVAFTILTGGSAQAAGLLVADGGSSTAKLLPLVNSGELAQVI